MFLEDISITTSSTTYAVSGTCSENTRTVTIKVDGAGAATPVGFVCDGTAFSGTIDVTALAQGAHNMTATISDLAGNTTESAVINFSIDTVAPTITSVTIPVDDNYITGATLNFVVNFNDNVTVVTTGGTPRIAITLTSGTVYANYLSGSGTSALNFQYSVEAAHTEATAIALASPLELNGGTIRDANANNALVTFTPPANAITINNGLAELQWQYTDGTPVTLHDFGSPGGNTSITLQVKNIGTATSGTIAVTVAGSSRLTVGTNSCNTLIVNATCQVTINYNNGGQASLRAATFNATATPGNTVTLDVQGEKL